MRNNPPSIPLFGTYYSSHLSLSSSDQTIYSSMEEQGIWKENWKVAAFMVDPNQRIRLKSLVDILQELANNHANFRRCGFEDMKANGKFWVLNRQAIEIDEWPMWEQEIKVESWISMMKGPFSLRHFAVYNLEGETMVRASYLWTCIDRAKMKPATIPEGDFPVLEERPINVPQPKKIKLSGEVIDEQKYIVRNSDLDIIGHTNNASYLEWATNKITDQNFNFNALHVNYTGESFKGEEITIESLISKPSELQVQMSNKDSNGIFKVIFVRN